MIVKYYIALFVLFGIIISSLQSIPYCHKWIMDVTSKISVEWLGFAGYFFMGHLLLQNKQKTSPWNWLLIYLLAVLAQGWVSVHMQIIAASDKFWLFTFTEAVSLFMLFKSMQNSRIFRWSGITAFSSLAMGIYIIHPFISENIAKEFWTAPMYLFEVTVVFFGSMSLSYVIMKIPKVGKWLLSV